jgi:hypothetical protein
MGDSNNGIQAPALHGIVMMVMIGGQPSWSSKELVNIGML